MRRADMFGCYRTAPLYGGGGTPPAEAGGTCQRIYPSAAGWWVASRVRSVARVESIVFERRELVGGVSQVQSAARGYRVAHAAPAFYSMRACVCVA